jgi:MoaA/NifB/PqqE/SkfB family radical SAM enzyme
MMGSRKALTGPLWVQIGIADACNHRCIMCWDHPSFPYKDNTDNAKQIQKNHKSDKKNVKKSSQFMEINMLKDLLTDLSYTGTRRIELAGRGEPTLHTEFNHIVRLVKGHGFNTGIVTNGSLLNHKCYENLVENSVDRIIISLNAGTSHTYPRIHTTEKPETFERIISGLRDLQRIKKLQRRKKPSIMLSFVITRYNYHEGLEMVERANDAAADQMVFKYAVAYPGIDFLELTDKEKNRFSGQLAKFTERASAYGIDLKVEPPIGDMTADPRLYHKKTEVIYSKIPCYIGWVFSLITAQGLVVPCCQCNETLGDLRNSNFREIWFSHQYDSFREKMKNFPSTGSIPFKCGCDECCFEKINTTIYNILHFYKPVKLHQAQRDFSLLQLLPAVLKGRTTRGAKLYKKRI